MSQFILDQAEESDEEEDRVLALHLREVDKNLSESDNSQARVFGDVSSDEDSLDGEYEPDFVVETASPDKAKSCLHLTRFAPYYSGLPDKIATRLPPTSSLWSLVQQLDQTVHERLRTPIMPPRKSKTPQRFEEQAEELHHPASSMDEGAVARIDEIVERSLKKKG